MRLSTFVNDWVKRKLMLDPDEVKAVTGALRSVINNEEVPDEHLSIYMEAAEKYITNVRASRNKVHARSDKPADKRHALQQVQATQRLERDPGSSIVDYCPICKKRYTIVLLPGDVEVKYCPEHRIVVPFPGENNIKYPKPQL